MKRILFFLGTLFTVITILFFLLRILPGGPFDEDQALPPEIKARLEERYHLNEPLYRQYASYISQLSRGDLGESYIFQGKKVSNILAESLPPTLELGLLALILSYVGGIILGVTSIDKKNNHWNKFVELAANAGSSAPTFLAAPILILAFSFWLDLLPPALWSGPRYFILPTVSLSLRPMCLIIRLIRTSGLENIEADYVKMALAKGVTESTVLFKHVLKNSVIPLIAISGSLFAQILSGGFIVEEIFAVPGIARHFIESVSNRDYALVIGLSIVYSFLLIFFNLVFDFIAAIVDPRMEFK